MLAENVKLSVPFVIVPVPVPGSSPSPRLVRSITPVPVTIDPFTVNVVLRLPDTSYLASVQVPTQVEVPARGPNTATATATVCVPAWP